MNVNELNSFQAKKLVLLFALIFSWVFQSYSQVGCYALDFDGNDDRVMVIGTPICPEVGSPFTISTWFYLNNLPMGPADYMAILSIVNTNSGTLNGSLVIRAENGPTDIRVFAYNNGSIGPGPGIDIDANGGLTANTWNHVAVVSDGNVVTLYLNGNPLGSDMGLANNCVSDILMIGKRKFNPPPPNNDYLDGRVDDVAFWNTNLNGLQILTLYNSQNPADNTQNANVQAYFDMEEGQGLALNDPYGLYTGTLLGDMEDGDWVPNPVEVVCPDDVEIYCWESSDPSETGEPQVQDCPYILVTQLPDEVIQDGDCDQAKIIKRTWSIDNGTDLPTICMQLITIHSIDINLFTIPGTVDVECEGSDTDLSPDVIGEPTHPDLGPLVDLEDLAACDIFVMLQPDQTLNSNCTGIFRIKRTWIIMDLVCGNSKTLVQIITVVDTEDPEITCPNDVTTNTSQNSCTASVDLDNYPPTTDDDCTNVTLSYTHSNGTLNPVTNVLSGLPIGVTTVTIKATDACGNYSECTYTITVEDQINPVAICDQVTISISGNPTYVSAEVFNSDSEDNCGIVSVKARRMNSSNCPGNDETAFGDHVPFFCCDVNHTVTVALRVEDAAGNWNICMVDIPVDDKIDPIIECPEPFEVNCWESTHPDVTGYPTVTDNCSVTSDYEDFENLTSCNTGTITRVWTATDAYGNTASCSQIITIKNLNPFSEDDIDWPADIDQSGCTLPSATGEPEYQDGPCDLVGHAILNEWTAPVANGCIKIWREWVVFDECQPSNGCDAFPYNVNWACWTHIQEITVMNTTAPVITSCVQPDDFCSYDDDCEEGSATLTVLANDDCNELLYFYRLDYDYLTNPGFNTPWIPDPGDDGSITDVFDLGTHLIKWKVEDGCGNFSVCDYPFVIKDCKTPNMNLIEELTTNIMQTGMVEVCATDFDNPNSPTNDNCGIEQWLIVFPSSGGGNTPPNNFDDCYIFDCDDVDLPQPLTVEIWVQDINGNWESLEVELTLQDNNNPTVCNTPPTFSVSGGIENEEGAEVEYVDVEVEGVNMIDIATTGNNGAFGFNLPSDLNYTITPERDDNILNGVSTYDLVLISKHILQFELLPTPYKIIAADINNSGSVSTLDLVELRKVILFIDDEFTNNSSWRFVDAEFVFPNPGNPFTTSFPEIYTINGLSNDEVANFVGIKIGDVNCSGTPNDLTGSGDDRNADGDLVFALKDQNLKAGETYRFDFEAQDFDQVEGFQFTMSFDKNAIVFNEVSTGDLNNISNTNFGLHKLNEGVITSSWNANSEAQSLENGKVLFSFSFTALQDAQLSDLISFNSRFTKAEAYDQKGLLNLSLQFFDENGTMASGQFELYQNQPNPFKDETVVGFYLPESGKATFKIFDIAGRVIKVVDGDYSEGYNEISINRSELQSSGVLYYQLESAEHIASKKMVLID